MIRCKHSIPLLDCEECLSKLPVAQTIDARMPMQRELDAARERIAFLEEAYRRAEQRNQDLFRGEQEALRQLLVARTQRWSCIDCAAKRKPMERADDAEGRLAAMTQEIERLKAAVENWRALCGQAWERTADRKIAMAEEQSSTIPTGTKDVERAVEHVIDHALNGRLTADQKRGVTTAIDRSNRVTPGSDAAVGRISRG